MRAAPGAVPRAIAQLSRRIDIASNPSTAARVAKIDECRVNPGPWMQVLVGRRKPGKAFAECIIAEPVRFRPGVMPICAIV
jgi:hypothetical protein